MPDALSVGLVLALAAEFAPTVAPDTMLVFAEAESGRNPYAINDNTGGRSYFPATYDDAIRTATRLVLAGHSVDMGALQINSQHLGGVLPSIQDAFNPGLSIKAGASILTAAYARCGGDEARTIGQQQAALKCAAARYNTGSDGPVGRAYAARLWRVAATFVPSIRVATSDFPDAAATTGTSRTRPNTPKCPSDDDDGWHVTAVPAGCKQTPRDDVDD